MPRIGGQRPTLPLTQLRGREIPQDDRKVVSTPSHDIQLGQRVGAQEVLPDLKMTRRTIADPEARPRIVDVPTATLAGVRTAADFKALLATLQQTHGSFLKPDRTALMAKLPDVDKSNYAFLNITGRRVEQFFDETARLIAQTGLRGSEATAARQAVNLAALDAFRGARADFDRSDTGTYWSYGHDAAFVHVFEKMLAALPEGDARRKPLQAQIDFIFAQKYTPHGHVEEENIERSLELVAIDKASRRVVSMTPDSDGANFVAYETLQVPATQGGPHAGRAAFRDGNQYFVEGTRTALSSAEVQSLVRTPVDELTFRRALAGEQLRTGFRYDWNGNNMLNTSRLDTSWWGHCDIKALMETILADMKGSRGVTEYRADSGTTTEFTRDLQLEALAALLNFDDIYASTTGAGRVSFGQTNFAGGRFDNRPTTMELKLQAGGSLKLPIRINTLSEKNASTTPVDLDRAFSTKIVDDRRESFRDNPDVRVDPSTKDTNYLDATARRIEGTTDGYSFDAQGRPVESKTAFTIDPSATSGPKVLVGTQLTDVGRRGVDRYYFDPATKELLKVPTRFVQQNGTFVAEESAGQRIGRLTAVELGREMVANDDVQKKLQMLQEAVKRGGKIATDSDIRDQVWNGEVHAIQLTTEWRSPDGRWERVGVNVEATFGAGKVGSFLNKLDDEGRVIESMELAAAVDFYWMDQPRIAPLISERGNWYVNEAMRDRGVVDLGAGKAASLAALQDLTDLVYLGLGARDNKKLFTIVHEGKRLVYEDEAAWRADVAALEASASVATAPSGGTTPGTGPVAVQRAPNLRVPDNDPAGIVDTVAVGRDGKVKDIKVDIDLKHTWIGDLDVLLQAPDGTAVKLHARGGREKDDIKGTYGVDLRAVDDLKKLVGKDVKGDWKLKVVDLAGQDVGHLVSWGLKIDV
jgi:hypothetical protein